MAAYVRLKDVNDYIGRKVNIFAVLIESGFKRKSRGTDYVCTGTIIDDSFQEPVISVNFFAQEKAQLPRIMSGRDIILLHRVVIERHNGMICAVFNKRFSSFALFEAKSSTEFIPYQVFSQLQITEYDRRFIARLRRWLGHYQYDTGLNQYLLQLNEIEEGCHFDLVCKVLHICEVSEEKSILFVWDGTDTHAAKFPMEQYLNEENHLSLQLEPVPLPRDVLCTFPCVGTVLRVIADVPFQELQVQSHGVENWVKLRNITCQLQSGLWQGVILHSSKICLLSEGDSNVERLQRAFDERILLTTGHMRISISPALSNITEIDYENASFSTLMDVLTHSEVTYEFKCAVRVIESYPRLAKNFRSTSGEHFYVVRLTLEDPTARIHA